MLLKTKLKVVVYVFSFLLVCSLALFSLVKAGSLTPPGVPGATLYTLEDIYQKLIAGTPATEADHNFGPSAGPSTPTMHSLTDIYGKIPTNDKVLYGTNAGTANTPPGSGTAATASQIYSGYYAFNTTGSAVPGSAVAPLIWQTDDTPATLYTQDDAKTHCTGLSSGGYATGWRLPYYSELAMAMSGTFLRSDGANNLGGVPGGFANNTAYWSATESGQLAGHGVCVTGSTGGGGTVTSSIPFPSTPNATRCVHPY